jgi:hypothetical protein
VLVVGDRGQICRELAGEQAAVGQAVVGAGRQRGFDGRRGPVADVGVDLLFAQEFRGLFDRLPPLGGVDRPRRRRLGGGGHRQEQGG